MCLKIPCVMFYIATEWEILQNFLLPNARTLLDQQFNNMTINLNRTTINFTFDAIEHTAQVNSSHAVQANNEDQVLVIYFFMYLRLRRFVKYLNVELAIFSKSFTSNPYWRNWNHLVYFLRVPIFWPPSSCSVLKYSNKNVYLLYSRLQYIKTGDKIQKGEVVWLSELYTGESAVKREKVAVRYWQK